MNFMDVEGGGFKSWKYKTGEIWGMLVRFLRFKSPVWFMVVPYSSAA